MEDVLCSIGMECKNCGAPLRIPRFGGRDFGAIASGKISLMEASALLGVESVRGIADAAQPSTVPIERYWVICTSCNRGYLYSPSDVFIEVPPEFVEKHRQE